MKIIKADSLKKTEKDVEFNGGNSLRLLTKSDNMGFGVCKTFIKKGGAYHWHYKRHLEACYCIIGEGEIKDLSTGEKHRICADTLYVLDKHDDHEFTAFSDVILISIFNPPLIGTETHDKYGNYTN